MDVAGAVNRWVDVSRAEIHEHGFAQIDLVDLLGDSPRLGARVGLECLQRIVAVLRPSTGLDGLLTLPLEPGTRWRMSSPPLDDLLATEWAYGPGLPVPGLYIVASSHWRVPDQMEEYKRPLDGDLPEQFVAYYREWRVAGENELNRCTYVRSLPC